ncbi:hypothetical protein RJT34_12454 [Clitoria ternatea]|uniref:Ribosomal eL28/Mak16 domain-containing protein n=1 Tax=Clitoria ternatea TaxID=43366 RepID=A0AAN9JM22_CLITE
MQHDEVIWQVIRHNHCSYLAKISTGNFCRNPYNVTGVCNRSSCPLANSRYATIREDKRVFYLYMKTIERAHMPKDLWERVKLPLNYEKALEVIDKHLMYWPKLLIHKIKQRLTKMIQIRIRMKKLALKTRPRICLVTINMINSGPETSNLGKETLYCLSLGKISSLTCEMEKIMTTPRKQKKREVRREEKAEKAALLEKTIEKELLERLQKGVYQQSDIYNYPLEEYNKVLDMEKLQHADEEEPEVEYVEGYDELEEEDDIEDFGGFSICESQGDDDDDNGNSKGGANLLNERPAIWEKIMTTPRKQKKREVRREEKAEKAALLEKTIEKELLERLQKGVYQQSDIYNYPLEEYNKVLDMEKLQHADEEEPEVEYVEGYDELEEEDDIEDFGGFSICESQGDDDDDNGNSKGGANLLNERPAIWEKIMTTPRKQKKREVRREEKAEKAALLEKTIEKELLERLQKGVYQQSDIYNYPLEEYNKVLDMEKLQHADEEEPEVEYVEGYDELEEEDDIEDFGGFSICESQGDDDDDNEHFNITQTIEKELLERLQKGVYQQSDIYNYPLEEYNKVLDMEKLQHADEEEPEVEYVEGYDELEEEDDIEDFGGFSICESQGDDDDDNGNSKGGANLLNERPAIWEKIMTTPRKQKKREVRREEKAEKAALLEKTIEKELLERLQKGVYQQSDIYNYPLEEYNKVLDMEKLQHADEEEPEVEYVEGYDELEEEDDIEDFGGFSICESQGDDDDDNEPITWRRRLCLWALKQIENINLGRSVIELTNAAESAEDEDAEAIDQRRANRKMTLASKRHEKNALDSKSRKKAKVLVEVEREDADERQKEVFANDIKCSVWWFGRLDLEHLNPSLMEHCDFEILLSCHAALRASVFVERLHGTRNPQSRSQGIAMKSSFVSPLGHASMTNAIIGILSNLWIKGEETLQVVHFLAII